jgi:aspartate aminotransferase/aminotransferase
MKLGKQHLRDVPPNDIIDLGVLAQQLQLEAAARNEQLPLLARLQIGEPSFRTPEHIRRAAIETIMREPLTYGPGVGWMWLRELLAAKVERVDGYHIEPENTGIGVGGTGAIRAAMTATITKGEEVLIPDPGWPYSMHITCCDATPVPYALDAQNEWYPDIAQLERLVTPHTRMLVINSPGNPTGAVFPPQLIADLLDFTRRHNLYLLSDECYDEIIFEGKHVSPATMLSRQEFESGNLICIYTFSKSYAMTGWRIGYAVTSTELMKTISYVLDASQTNVSTVIQRAAQAALIGPQACVAEMRDAYHRRRDLSVRLLKDLGRYDYTPHGAFYLLVDIAGPGGREGDTRQFAFDLLRERNVVVAPGSVFGAVANHHVRISLAASDEEIERGIKEICAFADRGA